MSVLSGVTPLIGGSELAAGGCFTTTVTITGATVGMAVACSPEVYPGDGVVWMAYVSAADTVTVKVCGVLAGFVGASIYAVSVFTGASGVDSVTATSPIASTGGEDPNISYDGTSIPMSSTAFLQGGTQWELGTDPDIANSATILGRGTNNGPGLTMFPASSPGSSGFTAFQGPDTTRTNNSSVSMIANTANALIRTKNFGTGAITQFHLGEASPGAGGSATLAEIDFDFGNTTKFKVLPSAIETIGVATASLPATPAAGMRATVTDALAPAVGSALVSGGAAMANVHWSTTSAAWIVDGI